MLGHEVAFVQCADPLAGRRTPPKHFGAGRGAQFTACGVAFKRPATIFRPNSGVGPSFSDSDPILPRPGEGSPFMWITPAYAQASPFGDLLSPQSPIWMMAIIFVIMYVLMIRPQQKRVKQ